VNVDGSEPAMNSNFGIMLKLTLLHRIDRNC